MFQKIKKILPKSEFAKNVLTLMTGTTIAQAIPIAISPILTRIYSPEDFGVFAIFMALTSIFGSIANGGYEFAIMLPEEDIDAINILLLGIIISFIISILILLIVFVFNQDIIELIGNQNIKFWLYIVPISVFMTGVFNVLNYYNNRKKFYKDIAKATVFKSISMGFSQVLIGILKTGVLGLVLGHLMSQFTANFRLLKNVVNKNKISKIISIDRILYTGHRYKNFFRFTLFAVLLNTFSLQALNLLITNNYSLTVLGYYALVVKVLSVPSKLIGNSIGQVFYQQAREEKQKTGFAKNTFITTLKKIFTISVPLFGLLYFFVEDLFSLVYGDEWKIAGEFAKVLVPLFFIRFLSSTLSNTLSLFEKQKVSLFINIILLLSVILVFYFSKIYTLSFYNFLIIYTIILSIEYILFLLYYYKLSFNYENNN